MDISHDAATDKDILDRRLLPNHTPVSKFLAEQRRERHRGQEQTHKVGVLDLLDDANVIELDVEVLVDALEGTADLDVVFKLDCDDCVDERLEEAVRVSPSVYLASMAGTEAVGSLEPQRPHEPWGFFSGQASLNMFRTYPGGSRARV